MKREEERRGEEHNYCSVYLHCCGETIALYVKESALSLWVDAYQHYVYCNKSIDCYHPIFPAEVTSKVSSNPSNPPTLMLLPIHTITMLHRRHPKTPPITYITHPHYHQPRPHNVVSLVSTPLYEPQISVVVEET